MKSVIDIISVGFTSISDSLISIFTRATYDFLSFIILTVLFTLPILLYFIFAGIYWLIGERKVQKEIRKTTKRRKVRKLISLLLMFVSSGYCIGGVLVNTNGNLAALGYDWLSWQLIVTQWIVVPIAYCVVVLGVVQLIKNSVCLVYLLSKDISVIIKNKRCVNKPQKVKKHLDVEDPEIHSIVVRKTREFINKYKKAGTVKQILTTYSKEYKELIKSETSMYDNNKQIAEYYFNYYVTK